MDFTRPFGFYRPPRLICGPGTASQVGQHAAAYGRTALLVIGGESLRRCGRFDQLYASLTDQKLAVRVEQVDREPSPDLIDRISARHRDPVPDCVIAAGGGSVIDGAKAISAMLRCDGSVADYLEDTGTRSHPGSCQPCIALPTTAGTGSEATKNAVLSHIGPRGYKKSLRHDAFVPVLAILDPQLSLECPAPISAACGMDALSQLIESYLSTAASPLTDSLALEAIAVLNRSIERVADGSADLGARGAMAYAACISGITLANAGLGVVHGIAGPLGGRYPVAHGALCAALLLPSMEVTVEKMVRNEPACREALDKCGKLGALMGNRPWQGAWSETIDLFLRRLATLRTTLPLPSLGTVHISPAESTSLATLCNPKNNPVRLDTSEMARIIGAALPS